MACSTSSVEAGYATPPALVLSLALALMGTAIASRSLQTLSHARADLDLAWLEFDLDGAHLVAAATVVRSGETGPFAWTFSTDGGWVRALAEPEADKLGPEAFAAAAPAVFEALQVVEPETLRERLGALADTRQAVDVSGLDPAPLWRDCGASLVSQFGAGETLAYRPHVEPVTGVKPAAWRIGETWRIRIATSAGWRDDRIVRFTGDARRPVAIVVRTLSRTKGDGARCEALLNDVAGG